MKSRRGNEAEDLSEVICARFGTKTAGDLLLDPCTANRPFSSIVGVGNAPIPGKSQDVVFEVAEAFQQTPVFALGPAAAFSGNAFRDGIGIETFYDQLVIVLKVFRQFLFRKSLFPFGLKHLAAMTQGLQQFPQQLRPCLVAGLIGVNKTRGVPPFPVCFYKYFYQ